MQSRPGTGGGSFPKPLQCRNWPLSATTGNRGVENYYTRAGEGGDAEHTYGNQEEGDPDKPCSSRGRVGDAPPSPGPLIPRRHLKQCLVGTLVVSAVVLASVALVISTRRAGHNTVVIHVNNSVKY
ncbi:uncharacterized protein LOC144919602 [Branchiostoma floridae x Branchiostoma belcheri]